MYNLLLRVFFPALFVRKEDIPIERVLSENEQRLHDLEVQLKIAQTEYNIDYSHRLRKALNAAPASLFALNAGESVDTELKRVTEVKNEDFEKSW